MKNFLKLISIIALVAVIGFGMIGCSDDDGSTDDSNKELPPASGTNAVSGKTYFSGSERTVFSTTAAGASSGTYTVGETVWDNDTYEPVLVSGKYKYADIETGSYTWNETAKTVTLKPEKVFYKSEGEGATGTLVDQAGYRKGLQDFINAFKQENGQAAVDKEIAKAGFSSETEFITYEVNEAFSNRTNAYSFSADGKSLFLEIALPANKGTDELKGQTYYGLSYDYDSDTDTETTSKDENKKYVFAASGNTVTYTEETYEGGSYKWTGSYAYDSDKKQVWFRQSTINGKDKAAYYTEVEAYSGHNYENDDAYRAAQTNGSFDYINHDQYNSTNKTIGWEPED